MKLSTLTSLISTFSLAQAIAIPQPKDLTSLQFPTTNKNDLLKRYYDYDHYDEPIRGVNIGGWLVLEPYITPSLFEEFRTNPSNDDGIPVDEYHYWSYLGKDEAMSRLTSHWDNFYTEQDFIDIKNAGFNLARIPIGYWAFETLPNDPYVSGWQQLYLDKAINWCRANGLKVWGDLHGAAGSQNGFDNSGLRDSVDFLQDENLQLTLDVLKKVLDKYSQDEYLDTVIGIELINEPLGPSIDMDKYKNDYLVPAYSYLRDTLGRDQNIIIHDAFEPFNYWDNFMTLEDGNHYGITLDHHHYQVFSSGELQRSWDERLGVTCSWGQGAASEYHWTVAGEFSAALTDCAKWLNGVGIGARYDGSFYKNGVSSYYIGSCQDNENVSSWSDERKQNTRKYIEAQFDAFEMRGGWIIWCYKTETSVEWGVNQLIANGLFPQPLTDRQYPGQCNA